MWEVSRLGWALCADPPYSWYHSPSPGSLATLTRHLGITYQCCTRMPTLRALRSTIAFNSGGRFWTVLSQGPLATSSSAHRTSHRYAICFPRFHPRHQEKLFLGTRALKNPETSLAVKYLVWSLVYHEFINKLSLMITTII
jgi:hypothetical protein